MNTHPPELLDLCVGHVIGTLEPRDRQRLWDHLSLGCATCEPALERWGEAVVTVAGALPPSRPHATLREKVLQDALTASHRVARPAEDDAHRVVEIRQTTLMSWKGWGLVFLSVSLAAIALVLWNDLRRTRSELTEARGLLARTNRQFADLAPWEALASGKAARLAVLEPARVRVMHDPASRRVLLAANGLADAEHTLWALTPGGQAPVAAVRPDAAGDAVLRLERGPQVIAEARGWAVTREPFASSGSAPAGPVVARGSAR